MVFSLVLQHFINMLINSFLFSFAGYTALKQHVALPCFSVTDASSFENAFIDNNYPAPPALLHFMLPGSMYFSELSLIVHFPKLAQNHAI